MEIKSMRGINSSRSKNDSFNIDKKKTNIIKWYETKYSLGGQRDIEFLEYIYKNEKIYKNTENIDNKILFITKAKNLYFIVDQFINITFSDQKPEKLTNKVTKYLLNYLNVKDLGNLKKIIKDYKNEVNKFLIQILKQI